MRADQERDLVPRLVLRAWLRLLRRDAERCAGLRFALVSPAALRCLLTMRAATSSSRPL